MKYNIFLRVAKPVKATLLMEKSVCWSITKSNEGRKTKLGVGPKIMFPRIGKRLKLGSEILVIYVKAPAFSTPLCHPFRNQSQHRQMSNSEILQIKRSWAHERLSRRQRSTRQMRYIYVTRKHTTRRGGRVTTNYRWKSVYNEKSNFPIRTGPRLRSRPPCQSWPFWQCAHSVIENVSASCISSRHSSSNCKMESSQVLPVKL